MQRVRAKVCVSKIVHTTSIGARQIRFLRVKCDNLNNGCRWTGKLGDLEKHLEGPNHRFRCAFQSVPCKYAKVGCEEKPLRKDLSKHEEDTQLHLQVTTDKVLELTDFVNSPKFACTVPCTIRLTNYLKYKSDKDQFFSSPFYTSYTGYKMCLRVDANGCGDGEGTYVAVFACLMKGDNDDSLSWPFTGTVIIELLNQLEDKNHYNGDIVFQAEDEDSQRVVDGEREIDDKWSFDLISHDELDYDAYTNTQYLKDDTLVF